MEEAGQKLTAFKDVVHLGKNVRTRVTMAPKGTRCSQDETRSGQTTTNIEMSVSFLKNRSREIACTKMGRRNLKKKYPTFDVTLPSGRTLTMSMSEIPSGDAAGITASFEESCRELAEVVCNPGEDVAKKTSIKTTNPLFNQQLQDMCDYDEENEAEKRQRQLELQWGEENRILGALEMLFDSPDKLIREFLQIFPLNTVAATAEQGEQWLNDKHVNTAQ
uniref:Uncharacterized protein n=1 Tax=Branchiostoma floridae TaxID=7739 RepID=C3Z187_BRAFL|eukprot:XP_002597774.1 hypothetical protein BRAFLDRAFT_77323 [Branchiostoma floridae]